MNDITLLIVFKIVISVLMIIAPVALFEFRKETKHSLLPFPEKINLYGVLYFLMCLMWPAAGSIILFNIIAL